MRSPTSGFGALAFVLMATLAWAGAADAQRSSRGPATIAASFSDSCRDFTAHATKVYSPRDKDISYVEIHHADGRVVKDETVGSPDYSLDGAAGDEIDFAIVKSGTTRTRFDCVQANSPPTAQLELKTPQCFPFFSGGLSCEQSAARTGWTSTAQVPDDGGSDSGYFHWVCGAFTDYSQCSWTIGFRGTSSSDPDNDIASWSIDFGDGTSASGSWGAEPPAEVAHTYSTFFSSCVGPPPAVCPVTLTVTDSAGQSDADTMLMVWIDQTPD